MIMALGYLSYKAENVISPHQPSRRPVQQTSQKGGHLFVSKTTPLIIFHLRAVVLAAGL